jgi:transposase-like protein
MAKRELKKDREIWRCPKCKLDKWMSEFPVRVNGQRRGYCNDCTKSSNRLSARRFQKANPELYREYHRIYRQEIRDAPATLFPKRPLSSNWQTSELEQSGE